MIRTGRRSHELSQEPHDRGDHVVTSEQLDIVVVLRKDAHAIAAHARTTRIVLRFTLSFPMRATDVPVFDR